MLAARAALAQRYGELHKKMLGIVRQDEICRRLMSVPGIRALVAITYRSAVDDPNRAWH